MNVLITGANGFIGTKLCNALSSNNKVVGIGNGDAIIDNVEYFNMDITDFDRLKGLFEKYSFDVVYHFAAITFHDDIVNKKTNTLYISLKGTENIVTLFNEYSKNGVLVYTSSGKVYGGGDKQPIDENTLPRPTIPLGKSKYMTERIIDYYSDDNLSNKFVILRMFNIYGYGQRDSFVVPHIIKYVKSNKTVPLGNLKDYRDYLYIDDLINLFISILKTKAKNQKKAVDIYNIGSGTSNCVQDILDVIESITNQKINIEIKEEKKRKDETAIEYSNSSKAFDIFGWKANTSLKEGIYSILKQEGIVK